MALVISDSQVKISAPLHSRLQHPKSIISSKLEDIAIIVIILGPHCQQPFLVKMTSDNQLSAAIIGPKWLVTTSCQQPPPY